MRTEALRKRAALLVLSLEENAADSLSTAIEYYFDTEKPTAWKHAIMLAGHSVEMFLKVALSREDLALLYVNRLDGHTVNYLEAIKRLDQVGVKLSAEEQEDIRALRQARNELEHLEIVISQDKVEVTLARVMRFLDSFLPRLDIDIATILNGSNLFLEFKQAIQPAEEWLAQAKALAEEQVPWRAVAQGADLQVVFCESCSSETVPVGDGIDTPTCTHCRAEFPDCEKCDNCGSYILDGIAEEDVGMCESCWSWNLDRE